MENLDRIEHFLDNQMNLEERAAFERKILNNNQLREEVAEVSILRDAIKSAEIRSVVQQVQQDFLQNKKPSGIQRGLGVKIWRMAAGIVLICAVSAGYWFSQISGKSILSDHALGYINPVVRSTEAEQEEMRMYFQNGNYNALLRRIQEIHDPSAEQYFLAAMAAFDLKDYEKADRFLSKTSLVDKEGIYTYELPYYEALVDLGQNDFSGAYTKLTALKKDEANPYSRTITRGMLIKVRYLLFLNSEKAK